MSESFDDVVREYISFVNEQVGTYMDALAGFAGHHTRVERQIHRVSRPSKAGNNEKNESVVVWASYEDPTKPDIIHNRIIRAVDYVEANSPGGSNEQKHARAIVVFLFTYWEDEIRPRLARAKGIELKEIRSDIMGDMRVLRNVILHSKSILGPERHKELKKLGGMFAIDQPLRLSYEDMHQIFVLIKQDCGRLMFEWLGVQDSPIAPDEIRDISIQRGSRGESKS
ncbi:MAG: hypothetical protein O7B35_09875 [Deltaproteobacteria bacterium]|nr:hypothetical protein [Deltaproteobacteria bacterium]